ncbi:hypothetical protein AMECASPLE_034659 [Ameca splendens]|uniref:Uncharacterized protein n=1 Tax=Ameca splendens TaxID=208324 RepID=A0ABV1AES2_9TELE
MLWVFFSHGCTFGGGFVFGGLVGAHLHGVGFVHGFHFGCSLLRAVLRCLVCCDVGVVVLCEAALAYVFCTAGGCRWARRLHQASRPYAEVGFACLLGGSWWVVCAGDWWSPPYPYRCMEGCVVLL